MSASPHVFDVTIEDFEDKVVEGSFEVPVMVDFWATWCGPCKSLGPTLERIVEDHAGAVRLAKVDVDKNPELAQAFRVQSVPMVVLIHQGRPVDAFTGAQPVAKIQEFLAPVLGAAPIGSDSPVADAAAAAEAGDLDGAIALLQGHLAAEPDDESARVALTGHLLDAARVKEARETFDGLQEGAATAPSVAGLLKRLELMESGKDPELLRGELEQRPEDLDLRMDFGRALIATGETEAGLEELYTAARTNLAHADGAPRKALLEVFDALGDEDPLTIEFRQRLSVLICS